MNVKPSPTLLRFVNLFCAAMMSGGLILTVAALRPALAGLPLSTAVLAQQPVARRATFYMPLCGALTAISAVLLIKRRILTKESTRFYRIGLGCMILVGLMSMYAGGVLDKEIAGWRLNILANQRTAQVSFAEKGAPADRHTFVWKTWDAINTARTLGAVVALACFIMANVQRRVFEHDA